jgi:asparagine synthase (glutamine-hydrolysing)
LYQIIQEFVSKKYYSMNDVKYIHNPPQTLEQFYYRNIFEMHYPNMGNVVPYFWMPRYVNAVDASARTLEIYNS